MAHHTVRRIAYGLAGLGLLSLFLLLLVPARVGAQDDGELFVSPAGGGDCTPAGPCTLATAVAQAEDGFAIYLAEGTYTGAGEAVVVLTRSLALFGGWDGTEAGAGSRDPAAHPAIVNGESARRGIIIGEGITVTLDGLTVTRGIATDAGAGLYAQGAYLTLRDIEFSENHVGDTGGSFAYGGGAYVEGGTLLVDGGTFRRNGASGPAISFGAGLAISNTASATVTDCLFLNNDSWIASGLNFWGSPDLPPLAVRASHFVGNGRGEGYGGSYGGYTGALGIYYASARVEDSLFADNHAYNSDGAVTATYSDLLFARNTVTGSASRTGGLCLSLRGVEPFTCTNNIFTDNARVPSEWGGRASCVSLSESRGQMLHNTIARNAVDYGITMEYTSTVALQNTILVSHTMGINTGVGCTTTLAGTLWGSGAWANGADTDGAGAVITGGGNISADPGFIAPNDGDYHLAADSPAIDAGVLAGVPDDIDGEQRPSGCRPDIGADEVPTECSHYELPLPLVVRR